MTDEVEAAGRPFRAPAANQRQRLPWEEEAQRNERDVALAPRRGMCVGTSIARPRAADDAAPTALNAAGNGGRPMVGPTAPDDAAPTALNAAGNGGRPMAAPTEVFDRPKPLERSNP